MGAPILFALYKKDIVVLDGSDLIESSWEVHQGNIYKTKINKLTINKLTINKLTKG